MSGLIVKQKWELQIGFLSSCFFLASLFCVNAAQAQSSSDLFVSSRGTNAVKQYDGETGDYIDDFVSAGEGGLLSPEDLIFGPDGHLYVTGFQNAQIKRYDGQDGSFMGNFTSNYTLVNPTKMTFHTDSLIYVSQWGGNEKVIRFDMTTGEFVDEFTSTRIVNGCGQAWDEAGNLYVASWGSDGTNGSIHKFDENGEFVEIFIPTGRGGLSGPVNVWYRDGDLFVGDWSLGAVLRYDSSTGDFIERYINGLTRLEGFVFSENGDLYLADWQSNRVNRYDSTGSFIELFASGGGMTNPNSITFRPADVATANEAVPDKRVSRVSSYPNPFRDETTLSYETEVDASVVVTIYSSHGALVRSFHPGSVPAGNHTLTWDGKDQSGRQVPSGNYYYRISAGGSTHTGSFVRVK